jgi:glucokinase
MDWSFSRNAIAHAFGFKDVRWINDFEANAYALPHLGTGDLRSLQHSGVAEGRLATVGPGTGLGGATLERLASRSCAQACEPGFMSLSPGSDYELALFKLLLRDYPDIYAELLVSGPGLLRLYQLACELEGMSALVDTPAGVSREALSGGDVMCERALNTFCSLLGSVCGDFVLANGAYGALFLAGGILPRILPFLESSSFLTRFARKGAMQAHLETVPVHVITAPHAGLTGAAYAPI